MNKYRLKKSDKFSDYMCYIGDSKILKKYRRYILTEFELINGSETIDVILIHDLIDNITMFENGSPIHADMKDFVDDVDEWISNNREKKLKLIYENPKVD